MTGIRERMGQFPGPAAVMRSVEMPARKVPFTRLTKIVVAKLPAADS
jgi:hypothetical protein